MSGLLFEEKNIDQLLPYDGEVKYFPPLFSKPEADDLFEKLIAGIDWRRDEGVLFGKPYITKRKVAWYGDSAFEYNYSKNAKLALPWTTELLYLKERIEKISGATYNSCLLNLYHSGKEGMGWHADDEKVLVSRAAIASLSLGAERRFVFKHRQTKEKREVNLQHGSMLVMAGKTQECWLHSLPKALRVEGARINLTFRKMAE